MSLYLIFGVLALAVIVGLILIGHHHNKPKPYPKTDWEAYRKRHDHQQTILKQVLLALLPVYSTGLGKPKFALNEEVETSNERDNFTYSWTCLDSTYFSYGKNEPAIVKAVYVDSSRLEEYVMNKYPESSFADDAKIYENGSYRPINWDNLAEVTTSVEAFLNKFGKDSRDPLVTYSYKLEFEDPAMGTFHYGFSERLLAYRQALQHA